MSNVLIIGNGFLGKKLSNDLGCFAVDLNTQTPIDITKKSSVKKCLNYFTPKVVIHTAAMTNVDKCEEEPFNSHKVNVLGTKNLYAYCRRNCIKMVYISTDFVFGGGKGDYKEEDETQPLSVYAKHKLEGEKIVMQSKENLVLRTSTLYGYNDKEDKLTFPTWLIKTDKEGASANIVHDQTTCPTLIDNVGTAISKLLSIDAAGTYNVVGREAVDRWKFAMKISNAFGLIFDIKHLKCVQSKKLNQKAERPKDSSLCIDKLRLEGIEMFDVSTGLEIMRKQMEGDKHE